MNVTDPKQLFFPPIKHKQTQVTEGNGFFFTLIFNDIFNNLTTDG